MPLQDRRDEALLRRVFRQFALLSIGLIALVVIGIVSVAEVQASRSESQDATTRGEVVAAAVHAGLGDATEPPTDPAFADAIESAAARAGVRAVLVWDERGTVVWSTRTVFVGQVYELDPGVREIFGTSAAIAAEGGRGLAVARPRGLLGNEIEVFSPIEDGSGRLLVVETYVDPAALGGSADTVRMILPLGLGGAAIFTILALLAGAQLAQRVQASRRERIKLLTDSLAAIDHERRRLAHDLHDGVIQDLAAMRYAITGVTRAIPADLPGDPQSQLRRVCDLIEEELGSLRGTLGELLPVERQQLPLPQTLTHLVTRLVPQSVDWSVSVDPDLETVDAGTAELVQRVVQEAVRNAVRHANPHSVAVRVVDVEGPGDPRVRVEVDDDGDGIGTGIGADADLSPAAGGDHVGIRLLRELVRDLDGDLTLSERPGGGTRLTAGWTRLAADQQPVGSPPAGA